MLPRTLEPEVMDTAEEARDYDAMDFAEVNGRFVSDLLALRPKPAEVLDVGTGTARIPIELCVRVSGVKVVALDLAEEMLKVARENVRQAKLTERIVLEKRDAKGAGWPDGRFEVVMSNSILHHIPEPTDLLRELWRLTAQGGLLFLRDLVRPRSDTEVAALVEKYAGAPPSDEPTVVTAHEHQAKLFADSLRAALTLVEVRDRVKDLGIPADSVTMTSDRHWTLAHVKA